MPTDTRATWNWASMSPGLQRLAAARLAEQLADQVSEAEAVLLARILPGIDLSALALSTRDAADLMEVSIFRVHTLRGEGRMPYMLELWADADGDGRPHCHTRVFWRAIAEVWGEYKRGHPHAGGHGRRWEP